jgi:hypothetical protein
MIEPVRQDSFAARVISVYFRGHYLEVMTKEMVLGQKKGISLDGIALSIIFE